MISGSLVVPMIDYKLVYNKNIVFHPFTPNQNTVCTVKSVNSQYITLEECSVKSLQGETVNFDRKYWVELEEDQNALSELNQFLISQNLTHEAC